MRPRRARPSPPFTPPPSSPVTLGRRRRDPRPPPRGTEGGNRGCASSARSPSATYPSPMVTPERGPVRVVLVDDHEMVIEGLKAMLSAFRSRVRVVGEAVGAETAMSVIDGLAPDIVLCDVRMQGSSGLDLCRAVRERKPECKVVLLSVYEDEQYLFQAMRAGASGYLLKRIGGEELVAQLERAHAGETVIDPQMAAR